MNSIENIVGKIISQAEAFKKEKEALAEKEKDNIISKANADANEIIAKAKQEASESAKAQLERCASSCDALIGNEILKTKVQIIDNVFENAVLSLRGISDEAFVNLMKEKIKEAQPSCDTVLVLNPKRKGVEAELTEIFKSFYSLNCSVRYDESIFGMLIIYGDITADCTFSAMVGEKRLSLEAKVAKLLFEE